MVGNCEVFLFTKSTEILLSCFTNIQILVIFAGMYLRILILAISMKPLLVHANKFAY